MNSLFFKSKASLTSHSPILEIQSEHSLFERLKMAIFKKITWLFLFKSGFHGHQILGGEVSGNLLPWLRLRPSSERS